MDFSLIHALNFETKSLAVEKARSASTLVGGIALNADQMDSNIST